MAPLAVFRFDASPAIGSGHAVRCLALAQGLMDFGWRVLVAGVAGTFETLRIPSAMDRITLNCHSDDEAALIGTVVGEADFLVVDHYDRDVAFEAACRPWARSILAIDDLADRSHDCELLLDQTLGRPASDYRPLVPGASRLLLGPGYALLREGFGALRPESLTRREQPFLKQILVSMGGTDPNCVAATVVQGIMESGISAEVDVVLGSAPASSALKSMAKEKGKRVRLLADVTNMAELMAKADLAIGAGGVTSWERCCMGLPALVIVTADNQSMVADRLAEAGAIRVLGSHQDVRPHQVATAVRQMVEEPGLLQWMSTRTRRLCDGRGVFRTILELIDPLYAADGGMIRLRAAELGDQQILLEWQRHPSTRRFARNPAVPEAAEHHEWLKRKLSDPNCLMIIVELDGNAAGTLRLDRNGETGSYEISILINPACYRRGIGTMALRLARRLLPGAHLVAQVLSENEASLRLFLKAGFRPLENGWYEAHPDQQPTAEIVHL